MAKLSGEFESGSMGRRRFIKALGAGAAAALGGRAFSQSFATQSSAGFARATAVNHISYAVADYARARDFYQQMFGMTPFYYKPDEPNAQAMLRFGNNTLYLWNSTRRAEGIVKNAPCPLDPAIGDGPAG